MKPTRLSKVLESLLQTRWPAFIWGPPGIGKSAIVKEVARAQKLPVVDLRASLLDPTDLRGIPSIQNGLAVWCPPSFLPREGQPAGVLFLDEINAAPPLVQASLYQLVLDRRVGEYELPKGWWIVAAGNRQQDRAITFRMSSALANRFVHIELETDIADWRSWAIEHQLDLNVISFLGVRPALLWQEPGEEAAFATPRSWEILSDVLKRFGSLKACQDLIPGIVGQGPAIEFLAFVKRSLNEKQLEAIVADPANATIPATLDGVYVLTSWLALNATREDVVRASAVLLSRIPVEFGVVLASDMVRASPRFVRESSYKEFMKAHGQLITR
jgi:hypothetical protein